MREEFAAFDRKIDQRPGRFGFDLSGQHPGRAPRSLIADQIASTLVRDQLATLTHNAALERERAADLEASEQMLHALASVLDIRQVFPRLSDITIEGGGADEPPTLRVHVPAGQPAGIYNGMIIDDETGVPVGTLSLRIAAV